MVGNIDFFNTKKVFFFSYKNKLYTNKIETFTPLLSVAFMCIYGFIFNINNNKQLKSHEKSQLFTS